MFEVITKNIEGIEVDFFYSNRSYERYGLEVGDLFINVSLHDEDSYMCLSSLYNQKGMFDYFLPLYVKEMDCFSDVFCNFIRLCLMREIETYKINEIVKAFCDYTKISYTDYERVEIEEISEEEYGSALSRKDIGFGTVNYFIKGNNFYRRIEDIDRNNTHIYFKMPIGEKFYAIVSLMSLHHEEYDNEIGLSRVITTHMDNSIRFYFYERTTV